MKRQFTSLRKQKIRFGSTFTCREGVSTPTTPVKIGTFELNVVFENWFKMVLKSDTYKLITSKTCVHFYHIFYFSLWDSEREFLDP